MTHKAFVRSWTEFGERFLLTSKSLVGPEDAWFKVCKSTRWWDDDRLPPEAPLAPRPVSEYRPKKKRRWRGKKSVPVKVTVRVLSGIGKDLVEWAGPEDHATPAPHRDREAEFHARIEREIAELVGEEPEWMGVAPWQRAA